MKKIALAAGLALLAGSLTSAFALTLSLEANGIRLVAGEPLGSLTLSYPKLFPANQKDAAPSRVFVTNHTATLYYANGAKAALTALPEGRMELRWDTLPEGRMKIAHSLSLSARALAGKATWEIGKNASGAFPAEKKADGFLFRGDALTLKLKASGSEGVFIDLPFGYQELQDQRAWGMGSFRWNSFAELPGGGFYAYRISAADGSAVTLAEGKTVSTEDIYMPYPAADQPALWPGQGPIRTFGWQDGIRRRYFANREKDENAIVFVGDSLTENWRTLAEDFPGVKVANRGVGGDTTRGILWRLPYDVVVLRPQVVVLCAGGNDLTAHGDPAHTIGNLTAMLDILQRYNARMPVVLCTVPPSSNPKAPLKPGAWDAVNQGIRALAESRKQVTLLDLAKAMCDDAGAQRLELFSQDRLHLGKPGYAVWKSELQPIFDRLFAPEKPLPDVTLDLSKFKLIWSEEFEGTAIDTNRWDMPVHDRQGASRWRPRNVEVADGKLTLHIRHTGDPTWRYESAGIRTARGYDPEDRLFSFRYGYIEASLKLPRHLRTDYWVGFWLLAGDVVRGRNDDTRLGTEIDIMETFDTWNLGRMKHTIHWGGYGKKHNAAGARSGPHIGLLDDRFHTYGLYWDEHRYVYFIDGVAVYETDAVGLGGTGTADAPKTRSQGTCRDEAYIKLSVEAAPWSGPTHLWEKDQPKEDRLECDYIRVYSGTLP